MKRTFGLLQIRCRQQLLPMSVVSGMLLLACSDDGISAMTTTDASSTTSDAGERPDNGSQGAGETAPDPEDVPEPADDSSPDSGPDSSDNPEVDDPADTVCPPGPYADSPLPQAEMVAAALPMSSHSVNAGGLAEGPVWFNGVLHISHFRWPESGLVGDIMRYVEGSGLEVAQADAGTNGLAIGIDGALNGAQHESTIATFDLMGGITPLVETFEGVRFNSPNDLVVRNDGIIYFTDPTHSAPDPAPQPFPAVYRLMPDGDVFRVDDTIEAGSGIEQPNGIALSVEQDVLYVGHLNGVNRFDVMPDGAVAVPSTRFGGEFSVVDGMTIDCAGNLYVTEFDNGRVVVVSPDGMQLGTIQVANQTTNVAFGGPEQRTLFVTAGDPNEGNAIYSVELQIPGYPT